MGNIATPNTPYCLGFQQASLSVGNKTFSTQNPPISYSIDGSTVTVFDALGVIGITSYSSDDFVEISSSPASPNTNYCSSAKAVLSWSSGTVETLNTPISYQLRSNIVEWGNSGVVQGIYNAPTSINSASIQSNANKLLINGQIETFDKPVASWQNIPQSQIRVEWSASDIVFLDGSTWTRTLSTAILYNWTITVILKTRFGQDIVTYSNVRSAEAPKNLFLAACGGNAYIVFDIVAGSNSPRNICGNIAQSPFSTTPCGTSKLKGFIQVSPSYIEASLLSATSNSQASACSGFAKTIITTNLGSESFRYGNLNPLISLDQTSCTLRVSFTDGTTQDLSYPTCPTVQNIPGCTVAIILANSTAENILVDPCPDFVNVINNEVTVFDSTGQIFKSNFAIPPINFQVTCYDFNITEVSYVCQGDCPSGTEFRCVCPATNTIMCYGFDPDNPNVFRPLFTTQITS